MKFQRILVPIALATLGFLTTHAAKLGDPAAPLSLKETVKGEAVDLAAGKGKRWPMRVRALRSKRSALTSRGPSPGRSPRQPKRTAPPGQCSPSAVANCKSSLNTAWPSSVRT